MANQLRTIRRDVGAVAHSSTINWGESYEVAIGSPKKVREIVMKNDGPGWYFWAGSWHGPFNTEQQADNAWIVHYEMAHMPALEQSNANSALALAA